MSAKKRYTPTPGIDVLYEYLRYDGDTGKLYWIKQLGACQIGREAGYKGSDGRITIRMFTFKYPASRIVWAMMTGKEPEYEIDHIDGNPRNNRFENLRDVPHKANIQNFVRPTKRSTTGYLGVFKCRKPGRWEAKLTMGKSSLHLGTYDCPKKAHEAYLDAKRKYHEGCTI